MTFNEFMRAILAVCPDALLDETPDGEIIVNTGLMAVGDEDTTLITMEEARQ